MEKTLRERGEEARYLIRTARKALVQDAALRMANSVKSSGLPHKVEIADNGSIWFHYKTWLDDAEVIRLAEEIKGG